MKTPIIILACIALAFSQMGGCATTSVQTYVTPANARTATALVCTNALAFVKTDAERIATANYIYSVAAAARSLSGGKVPTQDELKTAINSFTPGNGKYALLATNLASIWGAIMPSILNGQHLSSNTKVALDFLEAIAAGCEDASAAYLPPKP